jgi:hypothetical protein
LLRLNQIPQARQLQVQGWGWVANVLGRKSFFDDRIPYVGDVFVGRVLMTKKNLLTGLSY